MANISSTSWGLLECGTRVIEENFLGTGRDERALQRGRIFHEGFELINRALQRGEDLAPQDIERITMQVTKQELDPLLGADILKFLTWWASRMAGIKPIAIEEDGGRWKLEVGDKMYSGKFDCVYVNPENGRIVIPDLKSGFFPDKETAKRNIQMLLYAMAGMKLYDVQGLDILMVGASIPACYILEYDAIDIEAVRPFIERDAEVIFQMQELIAATEDKASLLGNILFRERLNQWCFSCGAKRKCKEYEKLVWLPDPKLTGFASRPAAVEALRIRAKLVDKEKEASEKDLKAEAAVADVIEGGYVVNLKTTTFTMKPTPGGERTQQRLIITRTAAPKGDEVWGEGQKPTTDGGKGSSNGGPEQPSSAKRSRSSGAKSAKKSRT